VTVRPFTIGLAGAAGWLAAETVRLGPEARRLPLAVLLPLAGLLAWQVVREWRVGVESSTGEVRPQALAAIGWALALPLSIVALGMIAGPPVYVLAFQRVRGGESWPTAIAVAALVTVFLWLLLEVFLTVTVPWGLLTPLVSGGSVLVP